MHFPLEFGRGITLESGRQPEASRFSLTPTTYCFVHFHCCFLRNQTGRRKGFRLFRPFRFPFYSGRVWTGDGLAWHIRGMGRRKLPWLNKR